MFEGALAGKTVWVTGAGGGIGREIAAAMSRAGAAVLATDINTVGPPPEGAAAWLRCNVTDANDIAQVLTCAREEFGGINTLVTCAALMRRQTIFEITEGDWDAMFSVNVKGVFLCAQAAAADMVAHKRAGTIITIGSLGSELPRENIIQYSASKGAVQTLTYALAVALAPHAIRVVGIMPGTIRTELNSDRWAVPGAQAAAEGKIPLRRLGTPYDIAPTAVFLASDAAGYATGSVFRVDGGRLTAG
jgi:NAD(P)-dependent dehydrogenase (short-subunit alcohol dehydrogenase family)